MEIKMSTRNNRFEISLNTALVIGLFIALVITFALYVHAEKQVDRSNDLRHQSLLLANELRQSSDDLTRMVRSYIATANPIYQTYYHTIIAIREGKLPRPHDYRNSYWELALVDRQPPSSPTDPQIALLDLMRQNKFSDKELELLARAKTNSDTLTNTEISAMKLVEMAGDDLEKQRVQAFAMVFGDSYNLAKANIMEPINQCYTLMDERTRTAVTESEHNALMVRLALIGFGLSLIFMLWRINQTLRTTLGGSLNEVFTQITHIGKGEFSTPINVSKNQQDTILGWLAETQSNLVKIRQERLQAEEAKHESDERYRILFDHAQIGINVFSTEANNFLIDCNPFMCDMLGYTAEELRQLRPSDVVADEEQNEVEPALAKIASTSNYFREWLLKRKDGSTFPAEVIAITLPDGTMMSMALDITERKLAQEKLRRSDERFRRTFKLVPNPLSLQTPDGIMLDCSDAFCELTGFTRDQVIDINTTELNLWVEPEQRNLMRDILMRDGKVDDFEFLMRRKDGEIRHMQISSRYLHDDKDPFVLSVAKDITKRKNAEAQVKYANERFRSTFKLIPNPLTLQTNDGLILDCSDAFCELTGFSRDEIIGHNPKELGIWVNAEERKMMREQLQRNGQVDNLEFQLRRSNGEIRNMQISARYLTTEPILLAVAHDITPRKQVELALQESAQHIQAILDNMFDGVITIDTHGVIESFNKAASNIFGYQQEEVLGRNITMLMPPHDQQKYALYLQQYNKNPELQALGPMREAKGQRKDHSIFPMSLSVSQILRQGKITFVGLVRDISQQRKDEEEIYRLAFYDPLTSLPNRRLLFDRLQQAINTSLRTDQHGALMFLDLDHFKQLNDSLGHDVGDILLQQVAQRLQACVREGDSVARMGGDEFVMLIEALSIYSNEAASQTENIAHKVLAEFAQPFSLREHTYVITPSIGIVLFLHQIESMDELLKKADVAMYQAKAAGRNNARFFDPTMQAAVSVRVELEKSMRLALERHEFLLHYQLQVDGQTNPTGVEALVRWIHPEHGMISPAAFIPLAEETGMILPLGQWVLEAACAQLVEWAHNPITEPWTMAVNVSASQFAHPDFVANVDKALKKTGANPYRLKLELTESMLVKDIDDVIVKMFEIKALGVTFSLDDFGTGYSSLSYLKRLPLDQLKIDQSFVRDLLTDPNDAAIAHTIIALSHSLSLKVIAEGVETAEQRDVLANMGCDAYQGYYFARPVAQEDLAETVQKLPH